MMDENCANCEFYDAENDRCTEFICAGFGFLDGCPPLPCETKEGQDDQE